MVTIIASVIGALAGLGIGVIIGITYRKKVAEKEIGSAELEATRLINEAIRSGESRKKELLLEAKDEIHKSRTEHDKEVKERRAELSKQERRLEQKEATLDKKTEAFERKEEELAKKMAKVAETQAQADEIKLQQMQTLERLSELTQEQAKAYIINRNLSLIFLYFQNNKTLLNPQSCKYNPLNNELFLHYLSHYHLNLFHPE